MIRIGMIGTGRIAGRAVKEIKEVEDLCLYSIFNPNREHADEFATKNNIECSYYSIDEFLDSVDAVYIASPHGTHHEYITKALSKKKHVLCEKPMLFNGNDVRKLYEISENNNVILMEALKTAYCPGFNKLEEIVRSGVIGDVVDVEAAFTRLTDDNVRELTDREYGGAFTEFGSYTMLPIFRFLGVDYEEVSFNSIPVSAFRRDKFSSKPGSESKTESLSNPVTDIDGYTKVVFKYIDKIAMAKTGLTVKSEGQLLISGTKGYILVPSPWWLTRYFEVRHEDPKQIEKYECEFEGDGLRYEFREFCNRIKHSRGERIKHLEQSVSCAYDKTDIINCEKKEAEKRAAVFEKMLRDRLSNCHQKTDE